MRTKPNLPNLTEAQADDNLRLHADAESQLDVLKAGADQRISKIKEELKIASAPLRETIIAIKARLFNWLWSHHGDFDKPRSKSMLFGVVGFRRVPSDKIIVRDEELAFASLRQLGLDDCIRVKLEVNKEVLAAKGVEIVKQVQGLTCPDNDDEPWFRTGYDLEKSK